MALAVRVKPSNWMQMLWVNKRHWCKVKRNTFEKIQCDLKGWVSQQKMTFIMSVFILGLVIQRAHFDTINIWKSNRRRKKPTINFSTHNADWYCIRRQISLLIKYSKALTEWAIHAKMRSGHSATEWGAYGQEWLKIDGNCDAVRDNIGQIWWLCLDKHILFLLIRDASKHFDKYAQQKTQNILYHFHRI